MPRRQSSPPPFDRTTAFFQGGCLSGFLIPPLAVIIVGAILVFIWLGLEPLSSLSAQGGGNEASMGPAVDSGAGSAVDRQVQVGRISPVFQPEVQYWNAAIQIWAETAGIDPNLVATVMQIESCGDPDARSRAGAMGLFQVMPYHFSADENSYNPDTNAARGLAYLKRSLKAANGEARLALAGYNGGIGVIGRPESSWPSETQRYAYWGSGIYAEASNGESESLRLKEWIAAGGASLCRQARSRLGINP